MEQPASLPTMDALATRNYTPRQWAQYYKNIWTRNCVAASVDVHSDELLKAKDPAFEVDAEDGSRVAVAVRLEMRKIELIKKLTILRSTEALCLMSDEELAARWTDEALAVAPDMIPAAAPVVKSYKVAKAFGDVAVGAVLELPAAGWTEQQVADKVADGTLELIQDADATQASADAVAKDNG